MYEKALVPIDGSEFCLNALSHIPRLRPHEVVLAAVLESVGAAMLHQTGIVADIPPDIARQVELSAVAELRRYLREAQQELQDSGWTGASTIVVLHGKPGAEIVRFAAETSCDIVVMATHGRTGMRRAILGSVADYVVSHIKGAAVLLVRPEAEETPEG